eukprot:TRINITY_DN53426_c0_g1_i1.p1 TRINITY_DN53426_c0_g1~~TRINITY_DN53426_c0_g1_i1.p1  ORF type:complete len:109 (+),score=5.34 TRINITY_DN53426_c0_g1_i1:297-623(+)
MYVYKLIWAAALQPPRPNLTFFYRAQLDPCPGPLLVSLNELLLPASRLGITDYSLWIPVRFIPRKQQVGQGPQWPMQCLSTSSFFGVRSIRAKFSFHLKTLGITHEFF